ncbi:MAG: hypothetical protein QOD99_1194 [Chthoniobacter sp.]|jgi:small-conductance mechanosensitive channel/CRP-like cAMP-binding protein|nr:hypothetical protein [Chthoniobacter sp.]
MNWPLTWTERVLFLACGAPLLYLGSVAFGRWLKRKAGVHLGVMYQLFCIVFAIYLPLRFLGLGPLGTFDPERHLRAALLLLGVIFALSLIRRYLWEIYFERRRGFAIPKFVSDVFALVVFLVALTMVLGGVYGQEVTGIILPSTVVVGIIGWAMQDLLGNIISGISLQLGKPFKHGDWLIIDQHQAEVIEVNWRSTRLRTNDDIYLDIPNNQIVRNTIINLSYPTKSHAMRLRVGVDYSAAPNVVKQVLLRAAREAAGVLPSPQPKVFLIDFGDSAVVYEIKYSIENHALYNDITDGIRTNIWYGLNRAKIKIPFPIRTLQIDRSARQVTAELPENVRALVCRQPFFQCLDAAQTDRLLRAANICRFGRNEKIITQDAEGDSMFLLAQGTAGVHVGRDGEIAQVATLNAGDYFGEMSLLTGEKRSATVIATTDCDVLEIEKAVFAEVLQESPALLQSLSEMLAQRRMENEGALASTAEKRAIDTKKKEYAATFLAKLGSFFEL